MPIKVGKPSKRATAALASGMGLIAMTATYLVIPWEGTENKAYWDAIGKVWTICSGETKGVKPGMTMTDEECNRNTYTRLENDFHRPLTKCIVGFDKNPMSWQAAILDLSWNVGVGAVCRSTAAKRARVNDFIGSCYAMTWYNRSNGQEIRGLKLRREIGDSSRIGELEICLAGLK